MQSSPNEVDAFDALIYRSRTSKVNDKDLHPAEASANGLSYRPPSNGVTPRSNKTLPKMVVKFFIHEEVSSVQEMKQNIDDISCHVNLEGTVHAQITSSEAGKNPPFALRLFDPDYPENNYQFDSNVISYHGSREYNTVKSIPKALLGQIKIASYQRTVTKKFMPILVQTKVVRSGANMEKCQLAIQIRSNLKNKGSLKDLVVCCAVPPAVIGKTLKITIGDGHYDELKRVIRWNISELPVGKSLIVGAEVDVSSKNIMVDEVPKFPVLTRYSSTADTISSLEVDVCPIKGFPVEIVALKHHSYRLLHRLPF